MHVVPFRQTYLPRLDVVSVCQSLGFGSFLFCTTNELFTIVLLPDLLWPVSLLCVFDSPLYKWVTLSEVVGCCCCGGVVAALCTTLSEKDRDHTDAPEDEEHHNCQKMRHLFRFRYNSMPDGQSRSELACLSGSRFNLSPILSILVWF